MYQKIILPCLLLLAISPAFAQTTVQATRAQLPPALDGKLDDACWSTAKPVNAFLINNTDQPSKLTTVAMLVYDDTGLYLAMKCGEPNPASIVTERLPRDNPNVFRNDCVEIMIDPTGSQNDYFHIAINAAGQIADRACTQGGFIGDMSWDSTASGASFIGPDYWSTELAIPFNCLGITPAVGHNWRVNICREKRVPQELSSIATKGAFNNAASFVPLQGIAADLSRYCYEIGLPVAEKSVRNGKLDLTLQVPLRNLSAKLEPLLLNAWLTTPSGKVYSADQSVQLPLNQATTKSLGPLTLDEQGEYTCYVRLADSTKKTLAYRKTALNLQYVPVTITLLKPWYRNAIFASQNLKQIEMVVDVNLDEAALKGTKLSVGLVGPGGASTTLSELAPAKQNRITTPNNMPAGECQIVATLYDAAGKIVAETTHPLRKLAPRAGEVWLSDDLQWYVDGRPFFINGAWNYAEDFLPEYNVFTAEMPGSRLLDTGLMNTIAKQMTSLREYKLTDKDAALVREYVLSVCGNPNLFAYYISDEPEVSGTNAKALAQVYDIVAATDPYHPVIISNDSMEGLRVYADCADINGLHPYPVTLKEKPMNDLSKVVSFTEGGVEFFSNNPHKQTIAYLHQGFNYGDYGAVNNRIPNYLEYRNQNLVSLICGARGTIQFNRMVAHYPELYIGMPYLTKELAWLEPILSSPTPAAAKPTADSEKIKLLLKEYKGQTYLLACNADNAERVAKLTVTGLNLQTKLQVTSEDRTVGLKAGSFTDHFGPWECHIYTTAPAPALKPVAQVVAEIAAANSARRKPGNLAYQEFEGDGVVVSASSSQSSKYRRTDTGLWHVVDGVIDTEDRYHTLTWQDDTPGQFPDWLEIRLPQAHSIGRVEVYPFGQSLSDYAVQVWSDGQWRDVAKVTGQSSNHLTHTFAPVTTDRIRLFVTATNGPNSMVAEVEVYEK